MIMLRWSWVVPVLTRVAWGVCDGNPHAWGRLRRCDQFDPQCPDVPWTNCGMCEGIGGIASNDGNTAASFTSTTCTPVASPAEMKSRGITPRSPHFPDTFTNTGFYEVQIFVKHDPFCFAQIPAMVSNGTHCFKKQQGTFVYDATQGALRIDYFKANTILPGVNMTEHFYHLKDGTVHPNIPKYGAFPTPICPCIQLGVGPVSPGWADDAEYIGREMIGVEFLVSSSGTEGTWTQRLADHYLKGPHHAWVDVETGHLIRMWQPFNGLEIFDPSQWSIGADAVESDAFKLPLQCSLEAKLGCINGQLGDNHVSYHVEGMDRVVDELKTLTSQS